MVHVKAGDASENSAKAVRQRPSSHHATKVANPAAESGESTQAPSLEAGGAEVPTEPRFHFFIIDSGWNSAAAQVIRDNLEMITRFQDQDPLFILNREQSTALIRSYPNWIGKDPILLARDLKARGASGGSEYHGFHLNMGLIHEPNKAVEGLRKFLHLLAIHRDSADIEHAIKERLHHKGLTGAIEVLRAGSESIAG